MVDLYNQYYTDKNTNQPREIDILAIDSRLNDFDAEMNLVIECNKSNTHAWVFFLHELSRGLWRNT